MEVDAVTHKAAKNVSNRNDLLGSTERTVKPYIAQGYIYQSRLGNYTA